MPNPPKINERDAKVMPELARYIDDLVQQGCIRSIIPGIPQDSPKLSEDGRAVAYLNSSTKGRDGFHVMYICRQGSQTFTVFVKGDENEIIANQTIARHYIKSKHGDNAVE